jgi:hypothetical protein
VASSFQRCQPHPVSITLPPRNSRRTFASTKLKWTFPAKLCTSGANGHHPRVSLVELYAVMGSLTRIWHRLCRLPQLRPALPSPSFLPRRRWAHRRVRLVDVIRFCRSRARLEVVPIESPSLFISLFWCTVTRASSIGASCSPEPSSPLGGARRRAACSTPLPITGGRQIASARENPNLQAAVVHRPLRFRPPPSVPAAGEHLPTTPLFSSLNFVLQLSPRRL